MIRRNGYLFICLAAFLIFSVYLYNGIDTGNDAVVRRQQYIEEFKHKVERLEDLAKANDKTIDELENEIKTIKVEKERESRIQDQKSVDDKAAEVDIAKEDDEVVVRGDRLAHINRVHQRTTPSLKNTCDLRSIFSAPNSSLQMLDLYDLWKFENPDGGVWKQGFPITYNEETVKNEDRLEIFVIPHSHCDPGWIHTFEGYYEQQTKNILNGMAKHLELKDGLKFIYAEVSFFEMWWREQTEETRQKVKKYLDDGKLEIVTGGWVMTDEANAHYHSMIVELFEGHEWIKNHLGTPAIPTSHWSIDPFGLSPSMPHILTSANITNAVIQRVHYTVKRELALKKNLEFYWRQLFGKGSNKDMRTHMMPFYSYDVPHTCGPEPAICCQFDFRRLPKGGKSCDWGIPPKEIDDYNVENRAKMLYDQYRKKAQLFKNNVIFAPLGDDFRYDIEFEWESQYSNYKKLFEYMNSKKEWNVHAQFGTLKDYFKRLDKRLRENGKTLETLSGDFFTYADRDDHYWSGYFTSRPFYKQLDRVLQHYLRSAEIAFSLANIEEDGMMEKPIFDKLQLARRALALFQHHDGVTGTAKDHVVLDYGRKMIDALNACEEVLSESLIVLLGIDNSNKLTVDETRVNENVLPEKRIYSIGQNVVLFNTLSRTRNEPVCIYVNSPDAEIEADEKITKQQIQPVVQFDETSPNQLKIKKDAFELCFSTKIGPMSTVAYRIVRSNNIVKSKILTNFEVSLDGFEATKIGEDFDLSNEKMKVVFDKTSGMPKTITHQVDKKLVELNPQFIHYTNRKRGRKFANGNDDNPAGAYLFLPDGEAKIIKQEEESKFIVFDGDVVKRVINAPNKELKIMQTFSIYSELDYLDIDQEIDIRGREDFELALRFSLNVQSGDTFYTDLNGLQMIKRKRQSKLPLQANYYPMSAGVFIEDDSTRLSIHSAQALGVSSQSTGQIEIMLDRRISTDDNRGLQQGVRANKRTVAHFRVLAEPMSSTAKSNPGKERVGYHSAVSQFATWSLHYPMIKMMSDGTPKPVVSKNFEDELHCDLHVVTLRSLAGKTAYETSDLSTAAEKKSALILHRIVPDCRSRIDLHDAGCASKPLTVSPQKILPIIKSAKQTTLTNLYEASESTKTFDVQPNEFSNILVQW